MNFIKETPARSARPGDSTGERRQLGRVVHDERGNAIVEWHPAPAGTQRMTLELANTGTHAKVQRSQGGYDPYSSAGGSGTFNNTARSRTPPPRTDLRKLSEHIKQMRELEARKTRGED